MSHSGSLSSILSAARRCSYSPRHPGNASQMYRRARGPRGKPHGLMEQSPLMKFDEILGYPVVGAGGALRASGRPAFGTADARRLPTPPGQARARWAPPAPTRDPTAYPMYSSSIISGLVALFRSLHPAGISRLRHSETRASALGACPARSPGRPARPRGLMICRFARLAGERRLRPFAARPLPSRVVWCRRRSGTGAPRRGSGRPGRAPPPRATPRARRG